jgi:hypothetical protein
MSPYQALSWSLAAFDGEITWGWALSENQPIPSPKITFQIRDVQIQESLPDSCGTVLGGHMTISGQVYEAEFK